MARERLECGMETESPLWAEVAPDKPNPRGLGKHNELR